MKPPGLQLGVDGNGAFMRVTRSDAATDAIYAAVETAIDAGWTVEQFRREAAECWSVYLRERERSDAKVWARP